MKFSGIPAVLALILSCLALLGPGPEARAQEVAAREDSVLIVGTKQAPPFAIKQEDGTWSGISIDLWRDIAAQLNVRYKFREFDLDGLLEGVEREEVDIAVAALTITAAREEKMDFTHPFYQSGLSIAVQPKGKASWFNVIKRFLSLDFLQVIAALAVVLLLLGALVWLFERRKNPEQFGGSWWHGIGAGFWWSAVTMTTVGYGDKAPVTVGGRLIALVWMFVAIIIISSFTAAITSALTVSELEVAVKGPADLPSVRVGTVEGATSEVYLLRRRISYATYDTPIAGMEAVADGEVDAMVYDEPMLRYLAEQGNSGAVLVLSSTFEKQYYGIAMPTNGPLREEINRALLITIGSPKWREILYRYLGEQEG